MGGSQLESSGHSVSRGKRFKYWVSLDVGNRYTCRAPICDVTVGEVLSMLTLCDLGSCMISSRFRPWWLNNDKVGGGLNGWASFTEDLEQV